MSGEPAAGFEPSATLIDHATKPRNNGLMPGFTGHACVRGECGDVMAIWVGAGNGVVSKASFLTSGCGTSHACGSMATVLAAGRPLREAMAIGAREILQALGGLPADSEHCAELAAATLGEACEDALVHLMLRSGALTVGGQQG